MDALLSQLLFDASFNMFDRAYTARLSGYGAFIVASLSVFYTFYIRDSFARKEPPPIIVWALWLLLDLIATGAELARGIINVQLIGYTLGTIVVCVVLYFFRRNTVWNKVWNPITLVLVGISVALWALTSDPLVGLWLSLTSMSISSIPLVIEIWKGIDESAGLWFLTVVGSVASYFDGNIISGIWLGAVQFAIVLLILYCRSGVHRGRVVA